jgi:PAS domain S-box-containing protein
VTEKKRAEVAVFESEERYRELFENANDIIYTHDLKGNFNSLNKTGERVTGYRREEALKMNIADVLSPESMETARQMLMLKSEAKISTVYELEIIAKDGRRVQLEVSYPFDLRRRQAGRSSGYCARHYRPQDCGECR